MLLVIYVFLSQDDELKFFEIFILLRNIHCYMHSTRLFTFDEFTYALTHSISLIFILTHNMYCEAVNSNSSPIFSLSACLTIS